ncbi:helix-turn-helix domain-containing protein [Leuconostoc falkenbergense]|uniref:helix-turn-helix domain-containing protein n=1 Tax=Leuconostoc falkenbergense TaxID=2766470 RepID=UPI001967D054|nr:helix-turn-helix domain-containing protein [Leuconostoc falkenbergense]QSB51129.1 IS30 family transposase [Leuconostoc falkenbergense]
MTSLSSQERTVIQTLLELNYSVRAIARFIKRSPSTVSIEIHQVTPYKAEIAHALALKKRHLRGRHDTLTPAIAVFLNHHIGILKWSPETAAHVLGLPFKTIYNWLNAGRLKLSLADLPDKGIRQKRQSDGRRQVFVHGRSIETRPESVKARQTFGHLLNRYVRRFIPKERKIETVSAKELDQINHWINARPMKTLNWQSPRKVFQQFAVFS